MREKKIDSSASAKSHNVCILRILCYESTCMPHCLIKCISFMPVLNENIELKWTFCGDYFQKTLRN